MYKLKMQTINKVSENVEKIATLFPNCVTESIGADGKPTRVVDFDLLRQELSGFAVEGQDERYQFTWADKKKSILLANSPISKTLRPCREESVNFDTTKNLYIEGDNLDVLKLLQETYMGKVKMIYIDPPYNTGNDFVYEDDFAISAEEYFERSGASDDDGNRLFQNNDSNGRFHTDWLNMIYPRLKLARDLLTDDGVIFISIDDNEQANLKKTCDEVFGAVHFLATFPWRKRTAKSDVPFGVSQDYEWVLCYAKTEDALLGLEFERKYYSSPDYPNDRWRLADLTTQKIESQRPNSCFDLIDPKTKKIYKYNPKRLWGITKDTFQEYYDKGKIVFPDDYNFINISIPAYRVFESEDKAKALGKYGNEIAFKAISTLLPDIVGRTENGNKECTDLLGNSVFSFPKPTELIKHFLTAATYKNSLILDFFSGSATTAHAVMQLNAEDGGNRKFIMIQLPEETDEKSEAYKAGYKNICEIGKERIRRAGQKIFGDIKYPHKEKNGIPLTSHGVAGSRNFGKDYWDNKNNLFNQSYLNTETNERTTNEFLGTDPNKKYWLNPELLDIGFRILKVDSSNMKPVFYNPDAVTQDLFVEQNLAENIKEDRTSEDLLFQVMLDMGVDLSNPITVEALGGKKVFTVGGDNLICCFDKDITKDAVTEIAKRKPLYAVFRDSSFSRDDVMVSFDQIFETYSPTTTRRVI